MMLLGLPVSANALGFGVPVLKSHLNEVLDVRVPLILAENESLNSVFVEFAKPNEYRLVGLEPYTDLSSMRVSVEHMPHGELYVLLSSVSVVQAPIVSLLLKARIGHNTHYKQVQLLLDTMRLGARTHVVKDKQGRSALVTDKAIVKNNEEHGWARTWRYGPVRSGDSLSTIAYRLRRDKQWSNHDVMLALYRFNPDAFIQHDINRLKSGVWLEIPREKALKKLLKQAPKPYENSKKRTQVASKKLTKAMVKPRSISLETKQNDAASQLRYVGRIALGNDAHVLPTELESTSSKSSGQLQEKLNQLYQQAMDDHLQMANLDQNIMAIRDDIGQMSDDIIALKEQQNIMQKQMVDSPSTQYWMLGFLLLVLLNIMLLGLFLYRKHHAKMKEIYDIEEAYFKKKNETPVTMEEPVQAPAKKKVRKKHLLENKIYDIENHLNLRNYEAVEDILKQLSQNEHEHFGVCALKARLYHETGRLDERDSLIRDKQRSLSDRQWCLLCDRLPINVWHALHESGVVKGNGTLFNVEESLTSHHEDATEIKASANLNQLQSDTVGTTEAVEVNSSFLELDDTEFKAVDEQSASELESSAPEDEFVSTVFITTLDGKKKLL
ncbi:MAG: FimV/HubP family polar landmark protein [Mariprofundaceae bacterium]|nr:FimV/HubP family polar landmark protein [Mariprofundaceae bacterium]